MSEEDKAEGAPEGIEENPEEAIDEAEQDVTEEAEESPEAAEEADEGAAPKKKKKKWPIVVGVIVVVIAAAGVGFFFWHEQPSFCNAICHTPMDPYNETYSYDAGSPGVDKYGNDVSDAAAMMCVAHKADAGLGCLDCHVPTIGEQISEATGWVTGNYVIPLDERTLTDLTSARGLTSDQFCLNDNCHHVTADGTPITSRDDLVAATADQSRNPHQPEHGVLDCGTCHKGHRASVNYCSQCHSDATIPAGWLTYAQEQALLAGSN